MNEEIIQKFTKFREDLSIYILNSFTNKEAIINPISNTIITVDELIKKEIENNKKIISDDTKTVIDKNEEKTNINNLIYQLNTVINKQCISLSYVADYGSYKEYKITEHFKGIVPAAVQPAAAVPATETPATPAPATPATPAPATPAATPATPATAATEGGASLIPSVKSLKTSLSPSKIIRDARAARAERKAARKAEAEDKVKQKFKIYNPVTAKASTTIVLGMFALEEKLNEYISDIKNLLENFSRKMKNLFLDYVKNQKAYVSIFTLKEITAPVYKDLITHESAIVKTVTIDHIINTILFNRIPFISYFNFKNYFNTTIENHLYKIIDKSKGTYNINENLKLLIKMIYIQSFIIIGYIKIKPIIGGDSARYAFSRKFNTKKEIRGGGDYWLPTTTSELETAAIKLFLVATTLERCIPDSYTTYPNEFRNIRSTFYKDIDNIYSDSTSSHTISGVKVFPNDNKSPILDEIIKSIGIEYEIHKGIVDKEYPFRKYKIHPENLNKLFKGIGVDFTDKPSSVSKNDIITKIINRNWEIEDGSLTKKEDGMLIIDPEKFKSSDKASPPFAFKYEQNLKPYFKFKEFEKKTEISDAIRGMLSLSLKLAVPDTEFGVPELPKSLYDEKHKNKIATLIRDHAAFTNFKDTTKYQDFTEEKAEDPIKTKLESLSTIPGKSIIDYKQEFNIITIVNRTKSSFNETTKTYKPEPDETNVLSYKADLNNAIEIFYPKNEPKKNYKFITQGGSGSGKSFAIENILAYIIDNNTPDSNDTDRKTLITKIKASQKLLGFFINASTPNNPDSSRCLTSIKKDGNDIKFEVKGLESRRILRKYKRDATAWVEGTTQMSDIMIFHDEKDTEKSYWANNGTGNQPFHAFVDAEGLKEAISMYFAKSDQQKIDSSQLKNQYGTYPIYNLITEMQSISIYAYIYNTLYLYANRQQVATHSSVPSLNSKNFIVDDFVFQLTDNKTVPVKLNYNESTNNFSKNYLELSPEIVFLINYQTTFNHKSFTLSKNVIDDTYLTDTNLTTFVKDSTATILDFTTLANSEFKNFFKDHILQKLDNKYFNVKADILIANGVSQYETTTRDNITYTLKKDLGFYNTTSFIINKANLGQEQQTKQQTLNNSFKGFIHDQNIILDDTTKEKFTMIINNILNKFVQFLKSKKKGGDDAVKNLIDNAVDKIKTNVGYILNDDACSELFSANMVQSHQLLKLVVFAMDLYNLKVQKLCSLLTIRVPNLTANFDMIDIYVFEEKMSTISQDPIDTTSFVINLVNDKVMRVFFKFLHKGLKTKLDNEKDEGEFTDKLKTSVKNCIKYNNFVESIINESMLYPLKGFDNKLNNNECLKQKYVVALNEISNNSSGTLDCPSNKKIVLHSTQKFLFYIDDIYSKVDMYNITDKLKTSNISDVDPNIILKLWTEKNKDTTLKSQCKKDSANIPVADNQNILLKTIQDIDNMLVERNELDGYVFIKCIKALSINTRHETTVTENKYKDNTFDTSNGYKLPKYTEQGLIDQRQNLGLGIILELEPKREYTLFNFVERTVTEKVNIITLINSIKTKFYTPEYTIFETKPYNEEKSSDDKITLLNGSQCINLKVYAQGKGSFTIKKFLENIFSLYGIIPHENNYIHN